LKRIQEFGERRLENNFNDLPQLLTAASMLETSGATVSTCPTKPLANEPWRQSWHHYALSFSTFGT
jgi:hypothetical protein